MASGIAFSLVDVFSSRPFRGNQLAVFHDAGKLTGAQMQSLAREMNFSESTFVIPARRRPAPVRVRIFTPRREIPMAGHPTIGTRGCWHRVGNCERERPPCALGWATPGLPSKGRRETRTSFGCRTARRNSASDATTPIALPLVWESIPVTCAAIYQSRPFLRETRSCLFRSVRSTRSSVASPAGPPCTRFSRTLQESCPCISSLARDHRCSRYARECSRRTRTQSPKTRQPAALLRHWEHTCALTA
ncbi:MAG: PhzF family phenazine biosynthesis protein [Deltaproteobacteria bacterium]|nr:PhzF family phenazine biosynthesis protein [Deltaproteobacteria bacterium]